MYVSETHNCKSLEKIATVYTGNINTQRDCKKIRGYKESNAARDVTG